MQSDSIAKLAEALTKAQSELKPVKKDTINPFFGKKYADLASVWEALKPFHANGIAITQMPYIPDREGHVGIKTQLTHTSGEWIAGNLELPLVKNDPQGIGSAITYARRYALGCMTGVVTEEDDDGNAASTPQPQSQAKTYTASKQTAAKKIAELRTETKKPDASTVPDEQWELFLDYIGDDPDRTNVGKQLKTVLALGTVADLKGEARTSFIREFQTACKDVGVPCSEWVKG